MSKLSELLNPAPVSAETLSSAQPPPLQPLVLDGRDHRRSSVSHGTSGSPLHTRFPSITSPGLEALADAASNTAPILSPPQHITTFTQSTPYQPSYTQHGSRPSSGHTLPSLNNDISHVPSHQAAPVSSDLEQYHHQSSHERRLSNLADQSARLPPLQHSPSTQHPQALPDASDSRADYQMTSINGEYEQPSSSPEKALHMASAQDQQNSGIAATSLGKQPWPGDLHLLSGIAGPESETREIEVKKELGETPLQLPGDKPAFRGLVPEGLTGVNEPMKQSPTPMNIANIKADQSQAPSPLPTETSNGINSPKPKPAPSKKRAAPKKGIASSGKPTTKKRKIDHGSVEGTPTSQRTATPMTNRASATPVPKNHKQGSETPARSSSVVNGPEDEDEEGSDDGELFCICRKPDDHSLMIGCDGVCDGWYHGRCVNIDAAKAKLVHKWYCPKCTEAGYETLWRRMCRLEGCREPARDGGENKSKYCSDDHGIEFMRRRALGVSEEKLSSGPRSHKKKRQDNYTDNFGNAKDATQAEADDDVQAHLRGGVLKASELKALTDGVQDVEGFRRLGDGVLSPPPSASPEGDDTKMRDGETVKKARVSYTPEEKVHLEQIAEKRDRTRSKKRLLDDRERFVSLVVARKDTVLAELKERDKSTKNICGYDGRLTWSDEEFGEWRASPEGQNTLAKGGTLNAPVIGNKGISGEGKDNEGNESVVGKTEIENGDEEIGRNVCKKGRCDKHKAWLKLSQQDIMFEKDQARQEMRKLEAEEKELKDRAMIRSLEAENGDPT